MDMNIEQKIEQTGLYLYELIEGETVSVFNKKYWMGKVMDWCMKDEAFKIEMFRFVDVFPYLNKPESVARHLREYFCRPEQNFPTTLQWGIKFFAPGSIAAKIIAKGIGKNIVAMGKQFIAGETPDQALPVLEALRANGAAFTVDLLGEAVVSETEAEQYCSKYLEMLAILDQAQTSWPALGDPAADLDWGNSPKINLSIKSSALYSQINARAFDHSVKKATERLRPILSKAIDVGAFVLVDMEHRALKDITLAIYKRIMEDPLFKGYPHTGIAIQAYLRDSEHDVKAIIQWAEKLQQRVTIRLVKGAYWDAEVVWARQNNWPVPVFENKHETDANFEKIARIIMQNNKFVSLACASHNMRSIAYTMEVAKELDVPANRLEYQILYGMAEPVRNALRKAGLPLRLYAPVGRMIPGMAYLVRRLLENTSNESFLRQSFSENVSKRDLLKNPSELAGEKNQSRRVVSNKERQSDLGPFRNEPVIDWTLAGQRGDFLSALKDVRGKTPYAVPIVIGNKKIETEKKIKSTNPNDVGHVVGIVSSAGKAEAGSAIETARVALPAWRDRKPEERAGYLFKAAAVARKMRFDLAALQVFEVGKTWDEADADVCEAIDFLEYYGREMIRLATPRRMGRTPGELSCLFYEPRGVGVVVAPWNFPLAISMGMAGAAVVAGNTVVYKPASDSPVIGFMLHKIFEGAELPAGVFNFLPGAGSEIGDYLVTHGDVAFISFTGSMEVGLRINELASKTGQDALAVKRVIAELGGKNAIIVDSDADLDEAVVQVIQSAFGYQGQKCSACSRLIVLEENYDRFVTRLKAAVQSMELGNPEMPQTRMGAVISSSARQKVAEYLEIGKKEGELLVERYLPESDGHSVPLAIFTGIRPGHRLAQEEIFGPVLAIIKVKDFEEALDVANNTIYALTGGVFSRSPENIARARREFRVGNLYINRGCTGAIVERHPFGGFKLSGVGSKAGGPDYLLQFMTPRNIVENTLRRGFAPPDE